MKRKIIYTLLVVVVLLIAFWTYGKYIIEWVKEKDYVLNIELPNSRIFIHNDLELSFYELDSIKSLIELTIINVDSILPNNLPKIDVFLTTGDNSATTIPELNKITLYNSEDCYAPFCHEYIHAVLGVHKELWFSEGVATYLGQRVRSKSKTLYKYCDSEQQYYILGRRLTGGPLKLIIEWSEKYNRDSIKELMLNTKSYEELTDKNRYDFYFFSASFCKYLFERIGEKEMISLLLKIKESHNSISKEFEEREIDLKELLNAWLINLNE